MGFPGDRRRMEVVLVMRRVCRYEPWAFDYTCWKGFNISLGARVKTRSKGTHEKMPPVKTVKTKFN